MLPERTKLLLASAVDGDLSPRDRRELQELLSRSSDARLYLEQLQRDALVLRGMRRKTLPATFAAEVMRLASEAPKPFPATLGSVAQKYLPMWATFAAAAAVLMAICAGAYVLVAMSEKQRQERLAKNNTPVPTAPASPSGFTPGVITQSPPIPAPPSEPSASPREEIVAAPPAELPDPTEADDPKVLAVPFNPKLNFFTVDMPKLPPILAVRELDHLHKNLLLDSIKGQESVHLDLFGKDVNKAFDRLQTALRGQGRRVLVEALAQQRLQQKLKTSYVVFTESMTADEIAKLFSAVAAEDRKAGKEAQLEKVVVLPMSPNSQKTMAALLGLDAKNLISPKAGAAGVDIQKPITDDTASALARALADKDKNGSRVANGRNSEPLAIALSFNPVRPNPALSREVREFLAARKSLKSNALPVMIVVRGLD